MLVKDKIMKRIVLLMLAGLPAILNAQAVKMHNYVSYYNTATHIPDSVVYTASPHVKTAHRASGFYGNPNLSADYLHSGYDIGHNADACDMDGSLVDEHESFNFINTYPQLPNLNRITWLALENYVRALNQPVRVKISYKSIKLHIGKDSVAVPLICVKDIYYGKAHEHYEMPNADTVTRHPFTFYRTL